jgi:ParB family chromosome partitioning protein
MGVNGIFKRNGNEKNDSQLFYVEKEKLRQQWAELREREAELARGDDLGRIHMLTIDSITSNPSQPRKNFEDEAIIRLADSIRRYGILQPLAVRRLGADNSYELIAGERRLRAARLLGLADVPCIIIDADEQKSAELAIIENIQRENLNIFEQAGAIASLIDIYDLTQEQIARQLSTSQSYVANKLRILRLTAKERDLILKHNLTERHARALIKIDDVEKRTKVIEHIIAKELNVSATEDFIERTLCEQMLGTEAVRGRNKLILKDIRILYNTIDKALNTVKSAGINVESVKKEYDDKIELTIVIPKQYESIKSA